MPAYAWEGRAANGAVVTGELEGFVLLGLVLSLVIPPAAAEKLKASLHAYAVELRRRPRT